MHEVSLASQIASIASSHALKAGASGVLAVNIRIGAWTCVNPDLLRRAFAAASDEHGWTNVELRVEMVQPTCRCLDCHTDFRPEEFHLRCEKCGSARVVLEQGREMEVESVQV